MRDNIQLINFTDLNIEEHRLVLGWRNNPLIKKWMYTQEVIPLEKHLIFIESLKNQKEKLYFFVRKDNENIGVVNFTKVSKNSLHMGIYANPELRGKGQLLLDIIIDFSFNKLHVQKIFSEVFSANQKAYQLYIKNKFKEVAIKTVNNQEVKCLVLSNDE